MGWRGSAPRRGRARCIALAVALAAGTVATVAPAPASAAPPPGTLRAGPKPVVAGAPSTSTSYRPATGRFGSDRFEDVLWVGPTESLWRGSAGATFAPASSSLQTSGLTALVGNFDGDPAGIDDVFWYGAGTATERYWRGTAAGGFTNATARSVSGTYVPVVGDFDGNGTADIFWYAPGSAAESLWRGTTAGGFQSVATSPITRTFTPVVGDVDADGRDDIYWYAPGSTSEVLWLGRSSGTFTSVSGVRPVSGTYTPISGDFNGDGRSDVYWYAPGTATDALWLGDPASSLRFTPVTAPQVKGTYVPAALDANGDGCTDVLWYGPGSASDSLFVGDARSQGCAPPPLGCPASGLDDWVWEGDVSSAWDDPANWAPGAHTLPLLPPNAAFPGLKVPESDDDVVCIPAGTPFAPIIDGAGQGDSVHVLSIDVLGSLEITNTGKLQLKGTTSFGTRPSSAHTLTMRYESALFGSAELTILDGGLLDLIRDPNVGGPRISTREPIAGYDSALPPGTDPLRILLATTATGRMSGGGLNAWDELEITNHGTFVLDGDASYVAADYGTSFTNLGTFELRGDGDYVQGFARAGRPLPTFANHGTLAKVQGTGESVIDATFTQPPPGTTVTDVGTVRIYGQSSAIDPPPVKATVKASATLATGGCAVPGAACTGAVSTVADDVAASLQRPPGAATGQVTIDLAPAEAGVYGQPIDLTAPTTPGARMTFRVVLVAGTAGTESKDTIAVEHQGSPVLDCTGVGTPDPCVDRAASTGTAGSTLTMVITTSSNGRWKFL